MLKIKDNVDLKELKKFGFKENQSSECWVNDYQTEDFIIYYDYEIWLRLDTHSISAKESLNSHKILNTLYDLIKADLVEKVSDENE